MRVVVGAVGESWHGRRDSHEICLNAALSYEGEVAVPANPDEGLEDGGRRVLEQEERVCVVPFDGDVGRKKNLFSMPWLNTSLRTKAPAVFCAQTSDSNFVWPGTMNSRKSTSRVPHKTSSASAPKQYCDLLVPAQLSMKYRNHRTVGCGCRSDASCAA